MITMDQQNSNLGAHNLMPKNPPPLCDCAVARYNTV